MEKTLYLVRHGQTLFNRRGLIQGWCDSSLTEEGIADAVSVRDWFARNDIVFDHAYSSTSERACDTLELITDLPYIRLKDLKEQNFGVLEGLPVDLAAQYQKADSVEELFGCETGEACVMRVSKAISDIMERTDHKNVLAVSHGCACSLFERWVRGEHDFSPDSLPNGCILIFKWIDGRFLPGTVIDPKDM